MQSFSRILLACAATVVASAPMAVRAQYPGDPPGAALINRLIGARPRHAPVSSFSVAGVTLGMTPAQARVALTGAGFRPRAEDPEQDAWSAIVSRRAAERVGGAEDRSRVPMLTVAEGSQGERVEVWYAATEAGARVSQVTHSMPANRMERAAFASAVAARYGRPTSEEPSRSLYCTKGETACLGRGNEVLPYLLVETSEASHVVVLRMGARYGEELKARMEAAVETAAPRNAKASF